MPRGNDPSAANELRTQYGGYQDAASMIQAHKSRQSQELRKAGLLDPDVKASAELDLDKIKSSRGDTAIAAALRGGYLVGVFEEDDGAFYKEVVESPDDRKKTASK